MAEFASEMTAFDRAGAQCVSLRIKNAKGLHARASAKFVRTAEQFDADIAVRCRGQTVNGRSIMGLLMLSASRGSDVDIAAVGNEACEVISALSALIGDGFGETDDVPRGDV